MSRMVEAVPTFTQVASNVRFTVNAWTSDNVFLEGDIGVAYEADGSVFVNPARVLTEPRNVMDRLAVLRPAWPSDDIRQATADARVRLRGYFQIREIDGGVMIELQGRRLRIRPETWRDAVADVASMSGRSPRAVRSELLDQGRTTVANAIAAFEWQA